jgi:two-component system, chemotaxis family, CheB/CheR fusion protein
MAIILSGTGSDGTLGLASIKEQGVIVQDPATAQFDGMPRSAIATGLVDLILTPEEMSERILG